MALKIRPIQVSSFELEWDAPMVKSLARIVGITRSGPLDEHVHSSRRIGLGQIVVERSRGTTALPAINPCHEPSFPPSQITGES
jgi:hypothetical protein